MITPSDSPSAPALYDAVTPAGTAHTPAPYDIQAPQEDLSGIFDAASALAGAGVLYPEGPRQAETRVLLESPAGFAVGSGTSGYDILAGYSGGGGDTGWPNNAQPGM